MNKRENQTPPKRHYPPFWEKFIPVALIIIVVIIAILILVILSVALGVLPTARL